MPVEDFLAEPFVAQACVVKSGRSDARLGLSWLAKFDGPFVVHVDED